MFVIKRGVSGIRIIRLRYTLFVHRMVGCFYAPLSALHAALEVSVHGGREQRGRNIGRVAN